MSTVEVPEGLTPKGDGTFYGEYRHVPGGWVVTCWAKSPTIVKDGVTGFSPDAIVRCWPPKPKWRVSADGSVVEHPDGGTIFFYDCPGLPERVARLLNEDEQ